MKHILITLLTFFKRQKIAIAPIALLTLNCTIAHAQMKLEITPSDSKYAKMQIDCDDQADCDDKLLKWIENQKFFKGEWKEDVIGSIVSKTETDMENNEKTIYFHASNFSVNLVDISAELAEQALEQAIAKKIACGEATIKFIAKNNVKKQLTIEQRRTMVQTYSGILDLLKSGSVDIAKADIQAVNADGTIVTEQDKTDIIAFITACE